MCVPILQAVKNAVATVKFEWSNERKSDGHGCSRHQRWLILPYNLPWWIVWMCVQKNLLLLLSVTVSSCHQSKQNDLWYFCPCCFFSSVFIIHSFVFDSKQLIASGLFSLSWGCQVYVKGHVTVQKYVLAVNLFWVSRDDCDCDFMHSELIYFMIWANTIWQNHESCTN